MKNAITIACLLSSLTFASCGTVRKSEPIAGPFVPANAKIAHGREVYMQNCQKCHPNGEVGLGPALNNKPLPEFLMKFQVRNGLGMMPSFSREEISSDDLDDLMEYVKALRRHG